MTEKPKSVNSLAQKELEKAEKQIDAFDENVKQLTLDRMNQTPKEETEPQTKISQKEMDKIPDTYIKPARSIGSREKFNERFRSDYEFAKQYVHACFENKEILGETLEFWTKPFPGMPCEFWQIPVNKPVWTPRYVAEQIKRKFYHRLVMKDEKITGQDGRGQYFGQMAADTTIQRLDCIPVSTRKSIFMGADF
jgi:hypothetical protein